MRYDGNTMSDSETHAHRAERLRKLELLRERGIDPYPSDADPTHTLHTVIEDFTALQSEVTPLRVVGRIMSIREHGALSFVDMYDGTAKLQVMLTQDNLGEAEYALLHETVNTGDFIEVSGVAFLTKREQKAVQGSGWRMLSKTIENLPTEHFGIKDEDDRYRKRYLDFLLNEESRDIVYKRAKFWSAVRRFHEQHGFLEVQTPILESTTGGGDARPFATHHHALDMDVYLRISAGELWQKRLMVAGFPKTFEIGRVFRNEGMSAEHLQDYEQCEAYWAYADMQQMYTFLKECYQFVAEETFGTQQFTIRGFEVDLSGEWPIIDYTEEIESRTGINIWDADIEQLQAKLQELEVGYDGADNRERLIDSLWKYCRRQIGGPAILINEPKMMSPLAKAKPDEPHLVDRFHFVIAGSELGQGYSELNDPIDQRERFERQQAMRDAGDDEAQMADMEFVEALEHGMPPTAGHGFSERVFAFLMDKPARETQLFPLMRPRNQGGE